MKKEEKTRITRAKIFEAAIKEFGTNGYAAGSLNNICKTEILVILLAVIVKGTIAAAAVINEIIAVIMAKKGFEFAGEIQ